MGSFNIPAPNVSAVPTAKGIQSQVQQKTAPARQPIPAPSPPDVSPAYVPIAQPMSPQAPQVGMPAVLELFRQIAATQQSQPILSESQSSGTGTATVRQSGSARSGDAITGQVVGVNASGGQNISLNTAGREPRTPRSPAEPRSPRSPRSSQDTGRQPRTRAPRGSRRAAEQELAAQAMGAPGGEGRYGEPLRPADYATPQPTGGTGLPFQGGRVGFDVVGGSGTPRGYSDYAHERALANYNANTDPSAQIYLPDGKGGYTYRPMTQKEALDQHARDLRNFDRVGPADSQFFGAGP